MWLQQLACVSGFHHKMRLLRLPLCDDAWCRLVCHQHPCGHLLLFCPTARTLKLCGPRPLPGAPPFVSGSSAHCPPSGAPSGQPVPIAARKSNALRHSSSVSMTVPSRHAPVAEPVAPAAPSSMPPARRSPITS